MDVPIAQHHIVRPAEVLQPAMKVGAFSGGAGIIVGGAAGIVRSSTPVLFATASGLQWFAVGSTFWATRGIILQRHGLLNWFESKRGAPLSTDEYIPTTPKDRVTASAIAGGITGGSLAALLRGRSNIIPATLMFTVFGYGGQSIYNALDARNTHEQQEKLQHPKPPEEGNIIHRIAKSRWSPMKFLSDEEYEHMLQEKLLSIEAEIAMIDDTIEKIKKERDQDLSASSKENNQS
ncbi:uncharacterized protein BDZ99DRAFT_571914 [Mytilinidion resinicola]|uniref:Uncharacterized protein n=1 Tax=Mytilinidion resinicola TaxID=574789 RepID=A0A6A6YMJ4_9PEZI|nr:uncharacterized protein BDZ99DRAFT_571914 [Mytilinidion resinicola]KAF2809087.1 hypothetical protein BDZ99DRAFT_571914 [Mytilinidion resinicola]